MLNMKTCNLVIAALTAIGAAVMLATSLRYGIGMTSFGPGPGLWPFLLGLSLAVIAVLLCWDTWRHRAEFAAMPVTLAAPANLSAYGMMLLVVVYAVIVFVVGFFAASLLFMPAAMYWCGYRRPLPMLAVTLLFLAAIYVIFTMLLHIFLPLPFFME